jgi:hypothetical protein
VAPEVVLPLDDEEDGAVDAEIPELEPDVDSPLPEVLDEPPDLPEDVLLEPEVVPLLDVLVPCEVVD